MLFFDPEKEPKKLKWVMDFNKEYFNRKGPNFSLDLEFPARVEILKTFFEKSGFHIVAIEEVLPFLGIICAKSK
jgi:hypothetical protein